MHVVLFPHGAVHRCTVNTGTDGDATFRLLCEMRKRQPPNMVRVGTFHTRTGEKGHLLIALSDPHVRGTKPLVRWYSYSKACTKHSRNRVRRGVRIHSRRHCRAGPATRGSGSERRLHASASAAGAVGLSSTPLSSRTRVPRGQLAASPATTARGAEIGRQAEAGHPKKRAPCAHHHLGCHCHGHAMTPRPASRAHTPTAPLRSASPSPATTSTPCFLAATTTAANASAASA